MMITVHDAHRKVKKNNKVVEFKLFGVKYCLSDILRWERRTKTIVSIGTYWDIHCPPYMFDMEMAESTLNSMEERCPLMLLNSPRHNTQYIIYGDGQVYKIMQEYKQTAYIEKWECTARTIIDGAKDIYTGDHFFTVNDVLSPQYFEERIRYMEVYLAELELLTNMYGLN